MPTDLLLPAFALTLLANAVLIALAVRGLRRGRTDSAPTRDWFAPALPAHVPGGTPQPPEPLADPAAGTPSLSPDPAHDAAPAMATTPDALPVAAHPDRATASDRVPAAPIRVRASRPRPSPPTATPISPPSPGAETATRRGRRKFSLPPIDDDHEKVTRSIESFLAGSDGAAEPAEATASASDDDARPKRATGGRARVDGTEGPSNLPTTIALVAIAGLDSSSGGRDDETIDPVALLERTLRGAARGGDEVHRAGHGRFRIVLPATGELAARAYLRRIRATVEPQLEAADRPLHLVVATATALNVPIRSATITARRRLEAALAAQPADAGPSGPAAGSAGDEGTGDGVDHDDEPEPRAAGD